MSACGFSQHDVSALLSGPRVAQRHTGHGLLYLAVLSGWTGTAHTAAAGEQLTAKAPQPTVLSVTKPVSADALLSNIELALRGGSLLSAAFYTDAQLRQFFGATGVKCRSRLRASA
jgi:hypothetical protein